MWNCSTAGNELNTRSSTLSGTTCTTDVNECWSSPCLNGGTCMDKENTFLCLCPVAYKGQYEINLT